MADEPKTPETHVTAGEQSQPDSKEMMERRAWMTKARVPVLKAWTPVLCLCQTQAPRPRRLKIKPRARARLRREVRTAAQTCRLRRVSRQLRTQ
jgi:hypothetical protein